MQSCEIDRFTSGLRSRSWSQQFERHHRLLQPKCGAVFQGNRRSKHVCLVSPVFGVNPCRWVILDAGCGSGRDSRYFLQRAYRVEAFDASPEMCRLAASFRGQTVPQKIFEEIDYVSAFDEVWACASLLHVPRDHMDAVLQRFSRAIRLGGVMFMSFKLRDGEWEKNDRFFNSYNHNSFRELIKKYPSFVLCSTWTTDDVRPDRKQERWLNALIRRGDD
jgi:SAM-dependent methyltransferase